jgi:hypothetical protein
MRMRYIAAMLMLFGCKRSTEPTSAAPAPAVPSGAIAYDFEAGEPNGTPPGFTVGLTGGGGPPRWEVQVADGAPSGRKVIAQLSADDTDHRFPHLVRDDFTAKDVDVTVSFKTIAGKTDAAAGLVFRYADRDNYYVVRANALENNVVAYKTERGTRSNIGVKGRGNAYGVTVDVPHARWNTLRVIAKGRSFEVFLNERKLFEVEDDTFGAAGKVGLWTKADSITHFDDLRVKSLDPP